MDPFPLFSPGLPRGSCGASNIFTAEEEASHAGEGEEASLSVDSDAAPKEALADATNGAAPLMSPSPLKPPPPTPAAPSPVARPAAPSPQKELFIGDMPPQARRRRSSADRCESHADRAKEVIPMGRVAQERAKWAAAARASEAPARESSGRASAPQRSRRRRRRRGPRPRPRRGARPGARRGRGGARGRVDDARARQGGGGGARAVKCRKSLEGLRQQKGRVAALRDGHLAQIEAERQLKLSKARTEGLRADVGSLVSLYEDALRRFDEAKDRRLSTRAWQPRASLAEGDEDDDDDGEDLGLLPGPAFSNVATELRALVVRVAARDGGQVLEYYHRRKGDAAEGDWVRADGGAVSLEIAVPGTHVFAARGVDAETSDAVTETTTAVFEHSLPEVVKHAAHDRALELRVAPPAAGAACGLCGVGLAETSYADADAGYALCPDCALPAPRAASLAPADRCSFAGNATEIKPESLELIDQLAAVLTSHENVDGLVLQGHTNSKCGLDCDGTTVCANDTCQRTFGASGGAVAFSLSRAAAVKAALVARGVDAGRIDCEGMAGSRRCVDDTESADNASTAALAKPKDALKDAVREMSWREKKLEYENRMARAKGKKLDTLKTCEICGADKAKACTGCGTTAYCSTDCQRIDWRDRGHRKVCKKIQAAEAARAEAPTPPPSPPREVF
ncbi:hypothetical protein JL722_7045 [Aureococcus anophagefferens]|nr:hypothetical protein JL722_7045 [Aureococcus anophagefferens]